MSRGKLDCIVVRFESFEKTWYRTGPYLVPKGACIDSSWRSKMDFNDDRQWVSCNLTLPSRDMQNRLQLSTKTGPLERS
jgi:hypothetical protein